jgi:hypothetical protein
MRRLSVEPLFTGALVLACALWGGFLGARHMAGLDARLDRIEYDAIKHPQREYERRAAQRLDHLLRKSASAASSGRRVRAGCVILFP